MIVTVGNTKGGVGKTTLAVNLVITRAAHGRDVLLVDGDEQRTALTFTELRAELLGSPGYTAVALAGAAIRTQVRQLAPKYDDVVIDVGGRNTGSLRAALIVSDSLLIPMQPRSFDLWAIDQMGELVSEARELNPNLHVLLVINAADAQGTDNQEAIQALQDAPGMIVLPTKIGRRKAFPNAAAAGRSVIEQGKDKDGKAVAELLALVHSVYANEFAGV